MLELEYPNMKVKSFVKTISDYRNTFLAAYWLEGQKVCSQEHISIITNVSSFTGIPKKPQHVFFHVFAQTTHVVAAPHGFACVGTPATRLYIPSFIEIRTSRDKP